MSENEVVIRSGRTIDAGEDGIIEIRNIDVPVSYIDYLTEYRLNNGIVCLSMGSTVSDGTNQVSIDVACRLRMNIVTAQNLHAMLGALIAQHQQPPDKSKAN